MYCQVMVPMRYLLAIQRTKLPIGDINSECLALEFESCSAPFIQRIPASHKGVSWEEMLKRWSSINQDGQLQWWKEHQLWMGAWMPNELAQTNGLWDIAEFWAGQTNSSRVGDALFLDQRLYLAEGVLTKVDSNLDGTWHRRRSIFRSSNRRTGQSNSSLFKLNRHGDKQILRGLLPQFSKNIQSRPKKGFGSPVAQWVLSSCATELEALPEALDTWITKSQMRRRLSLSTAKGPTIIEDACGRHSF